MNNDSFPLAILYSNEVPRMYKMYLAKRHATPQVRVRLGLHGAAVRAAVPPGALRAGLRAHVRLRQQRRLRPRERRVQLRPRMARTALHAA